MPTLAPARAEGALAATDDVLDAARRAFLGLELELALFDREIDGCRVWDYLRVEVWDRVALALGLLGEKQAHPDRTLRGYLRESRSFARSIATRNPYLAGRAELLLIGHPRRRREADGTYWDAYCDPLLAALDRDALLVERPHFHRHCEPSRTARIGRIAHLDGLAAFAAGLRLLPQRPLARSDLAWLASVEDALANALGARVPVAAMARAKLSLRRAQLPCWRALLRRVRPRLVLLVVSYGNEIPVEACHSLGIPTAELQHGVISPQNLGYHFPLPGCRKRVFPDWLLTFGEFWRDAAAFPIARERVVTVGFPYLETMQRRAPRTARARCLLFLSQRSIGAPLSRLAVAAAQHQGLDGEVIYKLHPGERHTWQRDYPWLRDARLRVIAGDEPHLYRLFAQATAQVGVYSTALFEGLAFGLETCVARLPGSAAVRRLVEVNDAVRWAETPDDLIGALDRAQARPRPVDATPFFAADAADNARVAIERILAAGR